MLGLDFIKFHRGAVDLGANTLTLRGETIEAVLKRSSDGTVMQVSRMTVTRRIVIPPGTVSHIRVGSTRPLNSAADFCLEPSQNTKGLLVARAVCSGAEGMVQVVNMSDNFVTLRKGHHLANATEVRELAELKEPDVGTSAASGDEEESFGQAYELELGRPDGFIGADGRPRECASAQCEEVIEEKEGGPPALSPEELSHHLKARMPTKLHDLFDRSRTNLDLEQLSAVGELLVNYADVFADHDLDLGCLAAVKHRLDTGGAPPFRQKIRHTPRGFEHEEEKHLKKMLDAGVIRPSSSEWASAPVLVRKKDGSVQYCVDFRRLNAITIKDAFPLPLIADCMDALAGTTYFSTLDMASGYYQIEIAEEDQKKTAFITKYGLFEHTRMAFGLCNAPATFQRAVNLVFRGLTWKQILAYIDDIMVLGDGFHAHLENLEASFIRLRQYQLKLKPKKCVLFREEVEFLGKTVGRAGISIQPCKIEAVVNWPVPGDRTQLQAFLGFANYHREHLRGFAGRAALLYGMAGPKTEFCWTDAHQQAFDDIKKSLVEAPCLGYPTREGLFILDTDASNAAIGAELSQVQDGQERGMPVMCSMLLRRGIALPGRSCWPLSSFAGIFDIISLAGHSW